MRIIRVNDVRAWYTHARRLDECVRTIGAKVPDDEYLDLDIGLPTHLRFVIEKMAQEAAQASGEGTGLAKDALNSISFFSLCVGLFLPISMMAPGQAASLFGVQAPAPLDSAGREALLKTFLEKEIGLTLEEKIGCVLGDPFLGKRGRFQRDSLMRLINSMRMMGRREALDRLARLGDVAILLAEGQRAVRGAPALTAAEVLRTLRFMPDEGRSDKFDLLRSMLERCGKLEAYFLAKLLLRKAGFGFDYQGPLIARALAKQFGAEEELVGHAVALTDVFKVAAALREEGPKGLRRIQLQPLVPVRPALASGTTEDIERYPVWVERKYDGIRLMLHKSMDGRGGVLCGAYTRARNDWLELVPGLDATIKSIPGANFILDGELHGVVLDLEGLRQASVYEVHAFLQGDASVPVQLRYAAFDIVYLNGADVTAHPLSRRRQILSGLLAPVLAAQQQVRLPVPVAMSEGQLAANKDDVNRLYHHFRAQGYEGVIAKDLEGPYRLATRDPHWLKRKPEITLDLVLLGGVLAVTTKENAGFFGSYVIGARGVDNGLAVFKDVGDVAGLDRLRDGQIQQIIMRDGLLTGRRIERPSASGVRPGMELRPGIVVTVKFEGITRDQVTGELALRDPKLVVLRTDKTANEADTVASIEEIYLRQRVG